jgi:hypothetical protein
LLFFFNINNLAFVCCMRSFRVTAFHVFLLIPLKRIIIMIIIIMFCWPCIIVYQYSETNVMHFVFNLLRIKGFYMFRALLTHLQEVLHKRHLVYCVHVMSGSCTRIGVELVEHQFHSNPGAANWHNTHAIYQFPRPLILHKLNKKSSLWFNYTDIIIIIIIIFNFIPHFQIVSMSKG